MFLYILTSFILSQLTQLVHPIFLDFNMHGMDWTDTGALAAGSTFVAVKIYTSGFRIKVQGVGGTQGRAYTAMQAGFLIPGDLLGHRGDADIVFLKIGDPFVVVFLFSRKFQNHMPFLTGIDPGLEDIEGQIKELGQVTDDRFAGNDRREGQGNNAAVVFHWFYVLGVRC